MPGVHEALHRTAIPLRSIAAGELGRSTQQLLSETGVFTDRKNNEYNYNPKIDWLIIMMEDIRAKLADRLTEKGFESNGTELFIQDVIRIVTGSPGFDIGAIKSQLHLLGWRDDYTDYGTIQLIQACYQDGLGYKKSRQK